MKTYETASTKLITEYPAYDIYSRKSYRGINVLRDGDELALRESVEDKAHNHLYHYSIGSVFGYAVENNDDPMESYNRAIENNHKIHWIIALYSCLTAHKVAKKIYYEVSIGEKVYFMGKYFEITKENNDNLGLLEIEEQLK